MAGVVGRHVTLRWRAAVAEGPADLYVLEGGFAPGQVLASLPVSANATSLTLTLAPGRYYARLHVVRSGVRGAASNELNFVVDLDTAPTTPAAFRAIALGNDVVLAWQPTFAGGSTDQAVLDVSGPLSGSIVVPTAGPIVFKDVPDGVYLVAIRAVNAAGSSPPSAPIRVELPWQPVQPLQTPTQAPDTTPLPVRYENFATPRLAQLVNREGLNGVVSGTASEFATILRLKDWVAAQWEYSMPVPYPPWDGLIILDWIRAGITGGFCGQYSQLFLQSLAAFGIPARYVEVGTTSVPFRHFTTEVWSNDHGKWVMLDVTFNSHFERHGVPLSALEIRDALLAGELDDVAIVMGTTRPPLSPFEWSQRTAELYYYVRYHLNANHLSAPHEAPFDRFDDMVEWLDGRTVPWELSTVPSEYAHELLTARATGDRQSVEWQPNQVWISSRRTGVMAVALDLRHSVLNFSHFEYRARDAGGVPTPWYSTTAASVTWPLDGTSAIVEVRGVNVLGVAGPVSSVQLVMP
ncbi:MAG: transglutaminase domain-containing protein [Vicinamibacterales bacterium]